MAPHQLEKGNEANNLEISITGYDIASTALTRESTPEEWAQRYDISGKALARVAGVSESLVSQFRYGKKGVTDEMLDNLLQAMQKIAPGSRKNFCSLVAGELVEGAGVENAIKEISAEEIPELLMAIARRWKSVDHPSIYATSALMQFHR